LVFETRVPRLLCGIACMFPCLAVLIHYQRVMDRQMDGHY